jgi:hypothetical protein
MNRLASGLEGQSQNLGSVQIGCRSGTCQRDGLVGRAHMQRTRVIRRVDRDACDTQVRRGPRDADRNFAAIGDEQPFKQGSALLGFCVR